MVNNKYVKRVVKNKLKIKCVKNEFVKSDKRWMYEKNVKKIYVIIETN